MVTQANGLELKIVTSPPGSSEHGTSVRCWVCSNTHVVEDLDLNPPTRCRRCGASMDREKAYVYANEQAVAEAEITPYFANPPADTSADVAALRAEIDDLRAVIATITGKGKK